MTNISLKKVLSNNYTCRISLITAILAPIFGIVTILSVIGIIPKLPTTQSMTMRTSIVFLVISVLIALLCISIIKNITSKLKVIFNGGKLLNAIITKVSPSKHSITIKYEFSDGEKKISDSHTIAKKLNYKQKYSVGKEIEIFYLESEGNISSSLNIY